MDKEGFGIILVPSVLMACLWLAVVLTAWGISAIDSRFYSCPDGLVRVDNPSMSGCVKPEELAKIEGIHW